MIVAMRARWALGLMVGASLVVVSGPPAEAAPPSTTAFQRAKVTVTPSEVPGSGMRRVLTDKAGYALYVFDKDKPARKRSSRCYRKCAKDWPPLLTKKAPKALGAAKQQKLGVTKRRDGTKQVTYADRPVYYYAHEPDPAFVGCHDVFLNGGFWYAIRASGKRLP